MFRGVRTATVTFDYSCLSNDEQVSKLEALLSAVCTDKDIAVLVNNVGIVKRDTMATAASQSVLN
jgi:short-subunit dehydrogenase